MKCKWRIGLPEKLRLGAAALLLALSCAALGCAAQAADTEAESMPAAAEAAAGAAADTAETAAISTDAETPHGVCYEVFVYSFCDSDGDGIGDLRGLTSKLDYIAGEEGLGCDMIWTMPVFPSPTYHKYDVTDYLAIDEQYGTMEDFDALLASCHERGVRLILDLPLNHTSSEHPWFQEAAQYLTALPAGEAPDAEACPYVDYYHFSQEAADGYVQLEGSAWYYEARFWSGMPDLNLSSRAVREEIRQILSFWLEKGVDGFRLDAVTSYYTGRATDNLAFLSWLNAAAEAIDPDVYFVAEAWTDQNSYAALYGSGIDSFFDFAFAGQDGLIARTVRGEKKASVFAQALEEEEALYAMYRADAVNAPFYTNHDMARSCGYYAWDDGSRTKLAGALNLLMTGNAFVYYGEELGMKGSGKDENKRAPMYWDSDPGAEGMCAGPPDMDSVEMKFPSLADQQSDELSIYSYYRHAIALRQSLPVIARGRTQALDDLSGDRLCVMRRSFADGAEYSDGDISSVLIAISTGEESRIVDLAAHGLGDAQLIDTLTVSEDAVTLEGGILTLPPFGIAVLTDPAA